jgi:hypothetical protein
MRGLGIVVLLAASILGGCTASTGVQRYSESKSTFDPGPELMDHKYPAKDVYRVHQQGGSGFVSINAVREAAERRAQQFCEAQGRSMVLLGEKASSPPYILGNFPRVEVVFAAVERPATTATQAAAADDPYRRLERLKQLLDSGALTQAEFESEKAKVLGTTQ